MNDIVSMTLDVLLQAISAVHTAVSPEVLARTWTINYRRAAHSLTRLWNMLQHTLVLFGY